MALDLDDLGAAVETFLVERHLATLTLVRPDGTPHVTPVGFSYDAEARLARIITWAGSRKARLAAGAPDGVPAAVTQVDGGRWLTVEGVATCTDDPERVAAAVAGYTARYREPKARDDRVAIELAVTRIMGRA